MSQTVFILGAGASARAGAPLMKSFISAAQSLSRSPDSRLTDEERASFALVLKARGRLQSVHSKAALDINNIETLFGAFEMGSLLGRLGDLGGDEIHNLRSAMSVVIARTIEKLIKFPVRHAKGGSLFPPPPPYGEFADLIKDLRTMDSQSVSIISFNYDIALDYALHFKLIPFSYCLKTSQNTANLDYLKLHGSLNWYRCESCGEIVAWELGDYFKRFQWQPWLETDSVTLDMSTDLWKHVHCGGACRGKAALIVPPTWNKGRFHDQLENVWRTAARHLSEAENVFVVGYSLPASDEFFRYFYALGSVGASVLNVFAVIDPDPDVSERFQSVLGPSARDRFQSAGKLFAESLGSIRRILKIS